MADVVRKRKRGRPPIAIGYRDRCRKILQDPLVWAGIEKKAREDPEYALKLAEQGYGRPPQSLDLKGDFHTTQEHIVYAAELSTADPLPTAAALVSVSDEVSH